MIEAGAVRFRPIALTAAAVVVGGLVMVLDPIFQGLAVALMFGAVVATAAHDGGGAAAVLGVGEERRGTGG